MTRRWTLCRSAARMCPDTAFLRRLRVLPWSFALERLERARNCWIATTRPDGRPHAVPVGVLVDGTVYFGGGSETVWARNPLASAW